MAKQVTVDKGKSPVKRNSRQYFIANLLNEVSNPVHRRLIEVYRNSSQTDDLVTGMENELGRILEEILDNED